MAENETGGAAGSGGSLIPGAVAAQLLEVTPPQFRDCVTRGWIAAAGRDRFTIVAVVQGYLRYLRNELLPEDEIRRARKREIDQRIAIKDKTLIPVVEHRAIAGEALDALRAELALVGPRVTADPALSEAITTEIEGALQRAADRLDEAARRLGVPVEPTPAAAAAATAAGDAERA
jgi:hypothetical protein